MHDDRATILLVDDQPSNLIALDAVLSPLGERLVQARSGREALRFLLDEDCALILLDVQMPDLDGFETASLIRARERTRYTPIIFVTAIHREEEHILKGYSHGAIDYILKPFNADTLLTKARFFLDQYRREKNLRLEAEVHARERDELSRSEALARADAEAQRRRLHSLFMEAPAAIAILRGPDHVFELANPRYEELAGREDLKGRACREALIDFAGQGLCEILDRVFRSGKSFVGRERRVRLRGANQDEPRFFDFVAQPTRDFEGAIDGVVVHAVDVTDSVRARQKLQEADRGKDEFLAMLSHELRNPLSPILTSLQLMRLRNNAEGAAHERAIIERQVNHLARLVDDLLDVSRATTGKIQLRWEPVQMSVALARALEIARPLIDERKHELIFDAPRDDLVVQGDTVRLAQAFANLLTNAAKYTPERGRIEVEARRDDGEIFVRVRDNGIGIPPARLTAMFELFVQGDRPIDRAQGGLGVGLTLVRRLVQLHGGSVEARSEGEGRGSEFVVRLPAAEAAQLHSQSVKLRTNPTTLGSRRVLVVDDNVDAAETLADALRLDGHEVRTTYDGASALAAASEFRPDMLLLDLGLPGLDGFEVARRIRQMPYGRDLRIVALTGYGQDAIGVGARPQGSTPTWSSPSTSALSSKPWVADLSFHQRPTFSRDVGIWPHRLRTRRGRSRVAGLRLFFSGYRFDEHDPRRCLGGIEYVPHGEVSDPEPHRFVGTKDVVTVRTREFHRRLDHAAQGVLDS